MGRVLRPVRKDKEAFFSDHSQVPYARTLDAHLDIDTGAICFWLNMTIVSDIIGRMLFDPEERGERQEKALSNFELDSDGSNDKGEFKVTVKKVPASSLS
jgi:hypothetical protein